MITIQDARNMLPKVGDVRMEIPYLPHHIAPEPEKCVVIEVNRDHLYYRVRFTGSGSVECYKVPPTGRLPWEAEK